jgi:hypothetical protein
MLVALCQNRFTYLTNITVSSDVYIFHSSYTNPIQNKDINMFHGIFTEM